LLGRYRGALARGTGYHHLLTGGIGSGKTALGQRLGEELRSSGRVRGLPVQPLYVNCWRRSNDRTILLELLRGVGTHLPDRGYGVSEMLDVFEQGLRKNPGHRFIILDEVGGLIREGTRLVYLLSRSREVSLGVISLLLIAADDVLAFLDPASRSSFGLTHRLPLAPYDEEALLGILLARARLALRPGSYSSDRLRPLARAAAPRGDARFALELLLNAGQSAEADGRPEISAEDIRRAEGVLVPTAGESQVEELPVPALFVLLACARSLHGPRDSVTSERARQTYGALAEEFHTRPMSRVTFWRNIKRLERDGLLDVEAARVGRPARLRLDTVPVSRLQPLLEARLARAVPGKL
ncbi:MAG: Cdc6/Cdc18 family protein, partial [Thermoplasmata archaeon]